MIIGYIKGQQFELKSELIVADSIDYLTAKFVFKTADWQGLSKWAHFKKGSTVYDIQLTSDGIEKSDHLNLAEGEWEVYLHGNAFEGGEVVERITTEIAKLTVKGTGSLNGESFPEIPASETERINAELADHEERIDALEQGGGGGGTSTIAWKPTVDAQGNISWQRTSSETAPETQNIKGEAGSDGSDGVDGVDGKSAYEIAVEQGFAGTEIEWLASLHGADGVDGVDGRDGVDGYTPVKGVDYFDGQNGRDGTDGENGQDGYTPVRGTDYWTAADIAEIKSYVDEAILGGAW